MKTRTIILVVLAVLAPAGAVAQTMYKCVLDGKTVYQAEPCPKAAKQDTVKPPSAPAPAAKGGAAGAATGADVDRTIELMSTYRACADSINVWGQEMERLYEDWRKR